MSRIHREESGPPEAPLVVLVHGSLDRSAGMARLARVLSDRWRVLRYDRRGYGRSWPHDGPFGVESQVADLLEVLEGRSAVLVGHSYGGHVALSAAQVAPAQVAAVSVYETPLSWMAWWPSGTAGGRAAASSENDAAEQFMRRLIGDDGWENLPERSRTERRREGTALHGELSALRVSAPWEASRIACPVVCAHGSDGSAHHVRGMEWLSSNLPDGRLVVLEGAAHGAHNSHAPAFAAGLVDVHYGRAGTSTS
ncbi:MAG: hypothetical protein RLZZ305_1037 [Actinomycetota bacterium]